MSECNHIWRVDGEVLPNFPLKKRVETLDKNKYLWLFVWLRDGENPANYDVCNKCKRAVRPKK